MRKPVNRAPSVKRLLAAFRDLNEEKAERIRGVIKGTINPLDFRSAEEADRSSYTPQSKMYLKLLAIDELLEHCGVETIRLKSIGDVCYSHSGHRDSQTIAYCNGIFMLTVIGDLIDKYGEDESSPF